MNFSDNFSVYTLRSFRCLFLHIPSPFCVTGKVWKKNYGTYDSYIEVIYARLSIIFQASRDPDSE